MPRKGILRTHRVRIHGDPLTFLVDANVLSEGTKPDPNTQVMAWLRENERELVVDPVILGELRYGILRLPRGKRRTRLEQWFKSGVQRIHCLTWDAATGPMIY